MASSVAPQPTRLVRPKNWNEEVEDAYRFQLAGYRDAAEYRALRGEEPLRWTETGFVKKLTRRDGCFYYFNRLRECLDKDVHKCKLYCY
ncbi:hypothetical protein BOX15_Mlig024898g1 [Macrostomum lignano]|uniref:Meiosis expressed gene 1 protein homolog n=1 Tax=Macrostomum lignano TaxID=282301 RepID=A0A267H7B5_9PLAT|nr:hypothetical protein BOX15_Mlig024898g2 [Macrostomum lignano]PAA93574.1 hypothetical protein BOX15_Mlig024898g1 [Macrostomum lignano]